ncbi:MAG: hypothetical protein GH150_06000 [Hadesarchaea archaeon]|nr:hypothetical protein [Hadesarchaea archaeon]
MKFFDPNWEVSDFVNAFDKMMGRKLKLARMDKNGILKLVEIPRKALDANSDIGKKIKELWAKAGASEEIKKFDAGIDANRGDMPAKHLEQIYAFYSLLVLCFLTFPHVTSTRYYGELISPDEYKKGLGIVDAARVLFGEMEKLLPIVERQLES